MPSSAGHSKILQRLSVRLNGHRWGLASVATAAKVCAIVLLFVYTYVHVHVLFAMNLPQGTADGNEPVWL